ncbi:hypothetical protein D9M68_999970 [compost metagenome]
MPANPAHIKSLYQFLLQENFRVRGLVLSCMKQDIILSAVMYDMDMTKESGLAAFRNLFTQADHYDDYLKKEFECRDRLEE